jgi:thiol-disulfide isomerase/thioredoxin
MLEERPNQLVLVLAACFGLAGFLLSSLWFSPSSSLVGSVAPSIEITDLRGAKLTLASYRGTPVVVNFWATWCPPCVKELPILQRAQQSGAAQVVAIAIDNEEDVRAFVRQHSLNLQVALAENAPGLEQALKTPSTIPYSVFIDRAGTIVAVHRSEMSQATFDALLLKASG